MAALLAAVTAVLPFAPDALCNVSAVSAEEVGTVGTAKQWHPTDFESAIEELKSKGCSFVYERAGKKA